VREEALGELREDDLARHLAVQECCGREEIKSGVRVSKSKKGEKRKRTHRRRRRALRSDLRCESRSRG